MSGRRPTPARRLLAALAAAAVVVAGVALGVAALTGGPGAELDAASPATSAGPGPGEPTGSEEVDAPRLAFLGDSLTVGVGAPPERGYAWQTAERLGWPIALVEGVSGSGFLAPGGGEPMPVRVPDVVAARPDVVVVAGGTNDVFWGFPPDDVQRAAAALLRDLRTGQPEARVVVLGPLPTSFEAVDDPSPTREAVRAAAEEADVAYLDAGALVAAAVTTSDEWDRYISPDGLHPNELGYAVLADALAAELGALVD